MSTREDADDPVATPGPKRAAVVSDDEDDHEPAKVQPKAIFASLGMSLGLTVANVSAQSAR